MGCLLVSRQPSLLRRNFFAPFSASAVYHVAAYFTLHAHGDEHAVTEQPDVGGELGGEQSQYVSEAVPASTFMDWCVPDSFRAFHALAQ